MADFRDPVSGFDVTGARKAGYSDSAIADYLAGQTGYDLKGAREAGLADTDIIKHLVPPPVVKEAAPETPPEPEPGAGLRALHGAGRGLINSAAGLVGGLGAAYQSAGTMARTMAANEQAEVRNAPALVDQVEPGQPTIKNLGRDTVFLQRRLARATPEEREAIRQELEGKAAALPNPEDTNLAKAGQVAKEIGASVSAQGRDIRAFGERAIPTTPAEESSYAYKVPEILAGLTTYIGAGAVAGLPGVIAVAGVDSGGHAYDEAKAKGASDEEAAGVFAVTSVVQGGMNAVPISRAMGMWRALPSVEARGKFVKAAAEMVESSGTLLTFTQASKLADNAIAQSTYDPNRKLTQGLGEDLGPTALAGALLPAIPATARAAARRFSPEETAAKVMEAPDVDAAIAEANRAVGTPVDVETHAAHAREYEGPAAQQEAKLLQLFGGLNRGTVERADEGTFHYRTEQGETVPLKVWDPSTALRAGETPAEGTVPPALVAAQKDHYGKLGIDVVYVENDPRIPFDGAVDPQNPNTIFLSNNPQRNAAQVAAHEVTHVLESTTLPDGTNLGDVLHRQIREGLTPEGLEHARERFGQTAPERQNFPAGAEGDAAHGDAVLSHFVRELGADIGGEAPRFQTFIPKVIDEVQARYGSNAARNVLQKLIDGIRDAMRTLREFFSKPSEMAEYGQPETVSQNWVRNLDAVHDTLAKMYAERFGTAAEKENARLGEMRQQAERERGERPPLQLPAPAAVTPPPITPENVFRPETYGAPRDAQPAAIATESKVNTPELNASITGNSGKPAETPVNPSAETPFNKGVENPAAAPVAATPVVPEAKPAAVQPQDLPRTPFEQRILEEKSKVWEDKALMGRVQPGVTRNENFAYDVARERVMQQDVGPDIKWATTEGGIPEWAVPEIARFYKPEEGQEPRAAFDAALDRWASLYEAEAHRMFEDRETLSHDPLKPERRGPDTDLFEEMYARLEDHYTGGRRGTDEDIPFESEPARAVEAARDEAAPAQAERPEGAQGSRGPGSDGVLPREAASETPLADKPSFSPRREEEVAPSAEYEEAYRAHNAAVADYQIATADYRARRSDDATFIAARKKYEAATEAFHKASEKEDRDIEARQRVARAEKKKPDDRQGVLLSPRISGSGRRLDTEPPGPALLTTREATPEELAARKRALEKEEAEMRMRGRKASGKPQESADDTALFGGDRQKTLFSPKSEEPFYSALTRGVEDLKITKATPGQWEATIRNMPGIKPEERAWVGLDDWLRKQPRSVTKAEVLDYLREHEVRVEEVEKGATEPELHSLLRQHGKVLDEINTPADVVNARAFNSQFRETTKGVRDEDVLSAVRAIRETPTPSATKFGTYVLPGGENYRELLLTLPPKRSAEGDAVADFARAMNEKHGLRWIGLMSAAERQQYDRLIDAQERLPRQAELDNFRGAHWDEPNVLAHVRFDDRTGPNGEKVLHIAEVQSDWHQQGRKRGYKSAEAQKRADEAGARFNAATPPAIEMLRRNDLLGFDTVAEARRAIANEDPGRWEYETAEDRAIAQEFHDSFKAAQRAALEVNAGVPNAPFKTSWPELAMKRMLRYAAENGYDRVSWDTGRTNADRYDLSKQIEALRVLRSERHPDSLDLRIKARGDREDDTLLVKPAELPDYVGKEMADRINADMADGRKEAVYTGLDLKVGGEGMSAFYDKQLPLIANKIGKKFGAKAEEGAVRTKPEKPFGEFAKEYRENWGETSPEEMLKQYELYGREQRASAHSIAITPAMREGVMQGQPLFSPRITKENRTRDYTPEEREAFERVGRAVEPTSLRDKIDEARDDLGRKLVRETLDSYIGIKGNDPEGYMAARLANSVVGAQEVFRLHGTLKFDGATYNYKDLNGGVRGLVKTLGPEAHDFLWWVAAHRAERLKAEDRENLFSDADIATLKQLNRGDLAEPYELSNGKTTASREAAYSDALRRYDALNRSVLDLVVDSGLVKRETVDALWADPFYVPFFRESAEQGTTRFAVPTSRLVRQYASKRLSGGSEKLRNDLWENALGNWDHMIDAALRNRAAAQIFDTSAKLGAAEKVSARDYDHTMTKAEKEQTTWVMVDGEKQFYHTTDPMVFKAVSALETASRPGPIMAVSRWFARALRYGVTANPLFAVRNLIRDSQNAIAVSAVSPNPFKNLADGFSRIDVGERLNNLARAMAGQETSHGEVPPEAVSAMAGGALMRLGSASDAGLSRTTILDTPGKLKAFGRYVGEVAGAYKDVLGSAEDVNRLALYTQLRKQGASHDFAAFSARDLQDFSLRGASPFVRAIIDITPFLGARMQGLYKLGRAAADSDRSIAAAVGGRVARNLTIRAATVLGAMTLAGLALDAIYRDDEDYRKRTEFDRQTYYWFKIGKAEFRIPKGFELAALSSLASDGIEAFFDKQMTGTRWVNNFWTALGTNLQVQAPAVIQPVIDLATNTRGIGGPIESMGMERLAPEQRYGGNTTLIARGLSSAINAGLRAVAPRADGPSPVQIEYLANGYGGWLASSVLGMADTVVRSFSSEPVQPARDFWSSVTQGMVSTEPRASSRYVDMLYDQGKKIEQAYATYRDMIQRGDAMGAQRFFERNRDMIEKHGMVSGVMRLEADLNRQIRMISNNPDPRVTAEQKKLQIQQLSALKSRAAEQAFGVQR